LIWELARVDDVDGDGVLDLAVGSIGATSASPCPEGCVHLAYLTTNGAVKVTQRSTLPAVAAVGYVYYI
jgi:hypothetical protein